MHSCFFNALETALFFGKAKTIKRIMRFFFNLGENINVMKLKTIYQIFLGYPFKLGNISF